MGQKGSKKPDLYVTDNETNCNLPDEEVKKFVGRAREYTAVDVIVSGPTPAEDTTKKHSSQPVNPYSITAVLNKAHRRGYQLSFVVPKVKGSKPSKLKRNSFLDDLQISTEAAKGGRLLSVMVVDDEKATKPQVNGNGDATEQSTAQPPAQNAAPLTLRMVFFHNYEEETTQFYQYSVACHNTKCTEAALKLKKNAQAPKSERKTNVTWSENWLNIFKDSERLIEVVNIGELQPPSIQDTDNNDGKGKKPKPRDFEVATLCFYETPIRKDEGDGSKIVSYDGLTREVWAPIDNDIQENLENEAEKYGEHGWELCTVLVTSHVRMKEDGTEFRKCAIFFQRLKKECVPKSETDKSSEDLTKDVDGVDEGEPSSPKDKLQKFGVAILKVDEGSKTRLKSTSKPAAPAEPDEKSSALPAVQLKKVDREKLKKEDSNKETGDKEVPWLASLEKKKKAVLESEEKSKSKPKDKEPAKVDIKKEVLPPEETKGTSKKETEEKDLPDETKANIKEKKEQAADTLVVSKDHESSSENDETQRPPADESSETKKEITDLPAPPAAEPTPGVEEHPTVSPTSTNIDDKPIPAAQETLSPPPEEASGVPAEEPTLPSTEDIPPLPEEVLPPPAKEAFVEASSDKTASHATEELLPVSAEELPKAPEEEIPPAPVEETPPPPTEELPKASEEEIPPAPVEETPPPPTEESPKAPEEEIPPAPVEETPPPPTEESSKASEEEIPPAPVEETPPPLTEESSKASEEEIPPAPVEETPPLPTEESPKASEEEIPPAPVEETPPPPTEESPKAPEEEIPPAPIEETPPPPTEDTLSEATVGPSTEAIAKSSVEEGIAPVDPLPYSVTEPDTGPLSSSLEAPAEQQETPPVEESKLEEGSALEAKKENEKSADNLALPPPNSTDNLLTNDSLEEQAPSIPEKEVDNDTTVNAPGNFPTTDEVIEPFQPEESTGGGCDPVVSNENKADEKNFQEKEETQPQPCDNATKSVNEDATSNDVSGNKDPTENGDSKKEKLNESSTVGNTEKDGTSQEALESSCEGTAET